MPTQLRPIICQFSGCQQKATIIHRRKALCGRHALDRVDRGERPDAWADFFGPNQRLMGLRNMKDR